jgi:hypothetical protein
MHAMRRIESPVNEQPNAYAGLLSTMPEQPSTSGHEDIVSEKELEKREKEERKLQLKQQKEREKQEKERLKREKEEQKALEKQMRKQRSDAGLDSSLVIENANRMDDMLLEQKSKGLNKFNAVYIFSCFIFTLTASGPVSGITCPCTLLTRATQTGRRNRKRSQL